MSPDFSQLRSALSRASASVDPAESHGILCGLLCASREISGDAWLAEVLVGLDGADPAVEACRRALLEVHAATVQAIDSRSFRFAPFLPEEDEPLSVRTQALADWCAGFLHGLSVAGVQDPAELGSEAGEMIEDLAEFTRVDTRLTGSESGENDYAELVEYLRVGVMLLRTELRRDGPPDAARALH